MKTYLFYGFVFLCLMLPPTIAQETGTITFSGGAPLGTHQPAVIVPVLKEAFKRNGYSFQAEAYPSERSLMLSNRGQTDGELHRIYDFQTVSKHRYPNLIRIDEPILAVHPAIFSTQNLDVEGMHDLSGLVIGYQAGRKNFETELKKHYPSKYIYSIATDLQAFKMLAAGRVDVVVSELFLGRTLINQNEPFRDIHVVWQGKGTEIYSYINSKYKKLGLKITNTLREMKIDGSLDKIKSETEKMLMNGIKE